MRGELSHKLVKYCKIVEVLVFKIATLGCLYQSIVDVN